MKETRKYLVFLDVDGVFTSSRVHYAHAAAANINMHGKKTKRMDCWCCVCIDFRDKLRDAQHKKEMRGEES
jgi:3-deoxy-D-manno-octulosonate 8-phosphate phosphatase KdsC-like HAD superfamily phosphatase